MPFSPSGSFGSYPPKRVLWKEGTDCCSWDGVTCNMQTGHVIGLDLGCTMLYGTLHSNSTLFSLHHLQKLDLSGNDFNRSVISSSFGQFLHLTHLNLKEISHLSRLVSLDLSFNFWELMLEPISFNKLAHNLTQLRELYLGQVNMSLVVPSSLMNLSSSLSSLQLRDCGLKGELPVSFGNLKQLEDLDLGYNNFIGPIPDIFANQTQLAWLDLSDNSFQGHLPFSLRNIKNLDSLTLSFNNFSGKISYDFFNLTQLTRLDLSYNKFDGQIPSSLGNFKKLDSLILSSNHFSGKIPYGFFNLTQLFGLDLSNNKLTKLDLSNNKFDGQIPFSLENLKKLDSLILSSNNFSGKIPDSFSNLTLLTQLDLTNNRFDGQIPDYFFNLTQLILLHLEDPKMGYNRLYGQIPPSVFKLELLRTLMLSSNDKLTGNISPFICELKSLEILDMSNNSFSGFIPQCLGNFSDGLSVLHLGANNLHGNIPSIYSEGNSLSYLNFNGNQLKGVIPPSIINCTLPKLEVVVLRSNKLHGSLKGPTVKDSFSKLQIFDLSNNNLSGPLPTEYFNNLAWKGSEIEFSKIQIALATLDLSCNKFTGKIPESLGKLKSLIQLNLSHNSLIGPIPQGKQFNTFAIGSYEGNLGLCGLPLQVKCNKGEGQQPSPSNFEKEDSMFEDGFGWKAVAMGYGCGFVFGVSIGYVVFRARKPAWFVKMVEANAHQYGKGLRRKNAPRNGGRRY
ncbi:receptor-like protein 9DC3 [Populus alba x Populus x berolinensis]|nr:receptor-like protein 9DC3 [Populus alba x Populus x berolinensis]